MKKAFLTMLVLPSVLVMCLSCAWIPVETKSKDNEFHEIADCRYATKDGFLIWRALTGSSDDSIAKTFVLDSETGLALILLSAARPEERALFDREPALMYGAPITLTPRTDIKVVLCPVFKRYIDYMAYVLTDASTLERFRRAAAGDAEELKSLLESKSLSRIQNIIAQDKSVQEWVSLEQDMEAGRIIAKTLNFKLNERKREKNISYWQVSLYYIQKCVELRDIIAGMRQLRKDATGQPPSFDLQAAVKRVLKTKNIQEEYWRAKWDRAAKIPTHILRTTLVVKMMINKGQTAMGKSCCLAMGWCQGWPIPPADPRIHPADLPLSNFDVDTQRRFCLQYGKDRAGIQGSLDCATCSGRWEYDGAVYESRGAGIVRFEYRPESGLWAKCDHSAYKSVLKIVEDGTGHSVTFSVDTSNKTARVTSAQLPAGLLRTIAGPSGTINPEKLYGVLDAAFQAGDLDAVQFASALIRDTAKAEELLRKRAK